MASRTDTALLLAPEWHVVVKDIVLVDPNLNDPRESH